ncbi:DUF559 domain-containing protein [Granulicoccus sp. GXG6511]|uniref:DUF559 domain-containing protein n=1 Tax=Granulicoccus sp. GXG6511 TaxID=3381351 RepID=UPI003D7EAFDB
MRHEEDIQQRLETDGIIAVREVDRLVRAALYRAAKRGILVSVLPGIFADPAAADQPRTRMLALHKCDPNAIFTGATAAALLWTPDKLPCSVEASTELRVRRDGFSVSRWRPDPDWVTQVGAFRCTNRELTAVDLIPRNGGDLIDRILRENNPVGQAALDRMWAALRAHPQRSGNQLRARLLESSTALPWSEAERQAHRQLHDHGIMGWRANASVPVGDTVYPVDLLFEEHHLIVEIDGFEFHNSRAAFEHDRARQNGLVEHGWRVLRFTWAMIQSGEWIPVLRRCLGLRALS